MGLTWISVNACSCSSRMDDLGQDTFRKPAEEAYVAPRPVA